MIAVELISELIDVVLEDFSDEELRDTPFMIHELGYLLGATPEEAFMLVEAAAEIRTFRGRRTPLWRQELQVH